MADTLSTRPATPLASLAPSNCPSHFPVPLPCPTSLQASNGVSDSARQVLAALGLIPCHRGRHTHPQLCPSRNMTTPPFPLLRPKTSTPFFLSNSCCQQMGQLTFKINLRNPCSGWSHQHLSLALTQRLLPGPLPPLLALCRLFRHSSQRHLVKMQVTSATVSRSPTGSPLYSGAGLTASSKSLSSPYTTAPH